MGWKCNCRDERIKGGYTIRVEVNENVKCGTREGCVCGGVGRLVDIELLDLICGRRDGGVRYRMQDAG